MQKSSHVLTAGTMDKKIVASTYQRVGFKSLFGTTKKGAPDSNMFNVNLDSIEQFFRELADGQLELRAVQKLVVTGSFGGGGGSDLKALEKRMSSLQSTTDRLPNKIGGPGGVRASLDNNGGDPENPMFGNVANWDYDKASKLPAYIEMRQSIEMLSTEDKKTERKEWCSSAIRTNPKLVMYSFDTYRGRHIPGCRNCWAEKGGEPPTHAYTACRSLRNPYYLICPHCAREHSEWPDACPAAPPRKSEGNGGGDRGGGGHHRGSGGGGKNNKKNRPNPYGKGGGNKGNSNSTARAPARGSSMDCFFTIKLI
eukprot:g20688.t1